MLPKRFLQRRLLLKKDFFIRKGKISKSVLLKNDSKRKTNICPSKSQSSKTIDRKLKTKDSSILKYQIRDRKQRKPESSGQVVEGFQTVDQVSELANKDTFSKKLLKRKSKTNLSCLLRNQTRKRKKRKMGEVVGVEGVVEVRDRISELPVSIIHHILSFLRYPNDVARTVVLSKKWKMIWTSFLTIDFDQRKFSSNTEFKLLVENSLETELEPMLCLQKFKLYLTSFGASFAHDLTRWLSAAIIKNVKELELHVDESKNGRYILPENALKNKMLTSLKLCGCKLDNYGVMDLPQLKELSIKKTYLNVEIIQSFIRGCPLIKDLRLVHCIGLGSLSISDHSELRKVEIHECHGLKVIDVHLPNLTSFWYCVKKSWQCKLNLVGCKSLRYLTLQDSNMKDELFQSQFSNFPDLENLVLKECSNLERITILSKKLHGLSIIRCKKLKEAIIDAPNLVSLEYTGNKFPFSSISVTSLVDLRLHFESLRIVESLLFSELKKFIEKFSKNEDWKAVTSSKTCKNVIIHEQLGDIQFGDFSRSKIIKIELTKSFTNLKKSVDYMLRMCHPKTISLMSSACSEFLKFLQDTVEKRETNPSCCRYYTKKCWLHYLEDVECSEKYLPSSCGGGDESREIPTSSASYHTALQTTFNLKWRSFDSCSHSSDQN